MIEIKKLKFNEKGLIPVVVFEADTKTVLMQAWMNEESLALTLQTGNMTYFSRSRNTLWVKGETSGNVQKLVYLKEDCDSDCLLAGIKQTGVACHTGSYSCFGEEKDEYAILRELFDVIEDRKANPKEGSYTNYLFEKGLDKILKKVGEEAGEVIIAAKNPDKKEVASETADLIYHLMVMLSKLEMSPKDVMEELEKRR